MWVVCFLSSLSPSFDGAQSQILGAKELLSLGEVFSRLCQATLLSTTLSPVDRSASAASIVPYRPPDFGCAGGDCGHVLGHPIAHQAVVIPEANVVTTSANEYQRLLTAQSPAALLLLF
ncbi:hypothetical protein Acr_00g0095500 [Actinidia rufa]|uniref:Uncharacterized protein n=1 Tax=Actinidia rufa TaxID=165716 RepID=A0A7J0DYC9_9ERIC|nr:hypothetical protein Acr_00g0095500 [Actinidia rufa]